ncbi:hypothetical protein DN068_06630 [Taibaiella soli]|uniref:Uncharacterized protein n=1 Tax=Taibaiella soli TaxID=1649169 RepID=A0A2W2B0Z3_9BACT|nr:hypothetical protein DN068_06630 [Taibaiella soli]
MNLGKIFLFTVAMIAIIILAKWARKKAGRQKNPEATLTQEIVWWVLTVGIIFILGCIVNYVGCFN